jgi:hypothetical protein
MRGLRRVHEAWNAPTILTDASLQIELVRYLWPNMRLAADVAVEMPHQHITQVIDRSYSLNTLDAGDPKIGDRADAPEKLRRGREAERARRQRMLREVRAKLHQQARVAAPDLLLAVAQKRIVDQIEAIGPLPKNVEWLHHGAVSGIDRYREVSRIVLVGRQAAAPAAVEACAEALTGTACTRLEAGRWYQRVDAVHELADGRVVATERDCHPDAIAEMFRHRITTLELQQIIGRGRGLWRDGDNPLQVLVLTDVPLELPIHLLTTADAERVSFEDRQMAVGGIAFGCAAHAAAAYPELWRNADEAQYSRRLYGHGQPAGTIVWRYRVAGQGGKPQEVAALPEMTAEEVRSRLTARLGHLATFERAEMQPKGASNCQKENPTGNSRHFGADDLPNRPTPFVWQARRPA